MTTREKTRTWLENWGLQNETIADIIRETNGNRYENVCYVGEYYVLKCTTDLSKMRTNLALAQAMADVGLYAATPVQTKNGQTSLQDGEMYFCLTRRLPGKPHSSNQWMSEDGKENAMLTGKAIGQLHLALEQLHLPLEEEDLLDTVQNWALPEVRKDLSLDDAFCERFLRDFAKCYPALPRQIIHRDLNPGNIIRQEDRWGFIDFELSKRGVRIFDPIYAATAVLSETFADWCEEKGSKWLRIYQNILQGYDAVNPLSETEKKAAPLVLLANQMICVAWFTTQHEYREAYEMNRRMTLWLLQHREELALV